VTVALLLTATLATFAADRLVPLGVAVWLLYLVPVVLTTQLIPQYTGVALAISSGLLLIGVLDSKEGISYELALINRGLGLVVLLFNTDASRRPCGKARVAIACYWNSMAELARRPHSMKCRSASKASSILPMTPSPTPHSTARSLRSMMRLFVCSVSPETRC
jgi:hypothetical protein